LQLVNGIFLGLRDCARAVVGRIDRVDIVVVSVDLRGLVDQVDSLVAVTAEGIGKVIEARIKRILLVLDLGKRILRCGQALGRRRCGRGIGWRPRPPRRSRPSRPAAQTARGNSRIRNLLTGTEAQNSPTAKAAVFANLRIRAHRKIPATTDSKK